MSHDFKIAPNLSLDVEELAFERLLMLGQSGNGKTNLALLVAEAFVRAGVQTIVCEAVGNAYGLLYDRDGRPNGLPMVVFGGDRSDLPLVVGHSAEVADTICDHRISAVLDLTDLRPGRETNEWMTGFLQRLYHRKRKDHGRMHIVLDEGHDFAPEVTRTPGSSECLAECLRFAKTVRNYAVGWTFASQNPQQLSKGVIGQANVVFAFHTEGEHDQRAVLGAINKRRKFVNEDDLEALMVGQAIVYSPKLIGRELRTITVQKRSTFDVPEAARQARPVPSKRVAPEVIAELKVALSASIKAADDVDPTKLRERLKATEAECERLRTAAPAPAASPPERVEVEVEVVPAWVGYAMQVTQRGLDVLATDSAALQQHIARLSQELKSAADRPAFTVDRSNPAHSPRRGPVLPFPSPARTTTSDASGSTKPVAGLKLGARRMLEAMCKSSRPSLPGLAVCVLANLSMRSSSTETYFSTLRKLGYAERTSNGDWAPTMRGRDAVGVPRPVGSSHAEIREQWVPKLKKAGLRRLFEVGLKYYPTPLSERELVQRAGLSTTSSSTETYLSTLKRIGLFQRTPDKAWVASDWLFPSRAEANGAGVHP